MKKCNHPPVPGLKVCQECRLKRNERFRRYYATHKEKHVEIHKNYRKREPWFNMLHTSKKRAKQIKLPFNLTPKYMKELYAAKGEICPVLHIPFKSEGDLNNRPSIDRIIPSLGYVIGNVRIISYRANLLKNNATIEEIELILNDLKRINKLQEDQ